ncbi:phospholipase A2 family protein [Actinidia rufa]|uniref:Phospholipase A2 family protein n=1 Tax=Actinidia rufa TaxID=165716 RepID=A0A7J0H4X6_9ERIC|nr:phospholipase A2 family protein [Actinidia rufa]
MSTTATLETPKQRVNLDIKLWGWSLLSFVPWGISTYGSDHMFRRFHGIQAPEDFFLSYSLDTGITVDQIGQVGKMVGLFCGTSVQLIGWIFAAIATTLVMTLMIRPNFLKADLAFLECLERPHMSTKGDAHVAHLYKTMCTSGLRNILIPYRKNLLNLQSGQLTVGFGWLSNMKWK